MFLSLEHVAPHLPGEPSLPPPLSFLQVAGHLLKTGMLLLMALLLLGPFWLLYCPLRIWRGKPPNVISAAQLKEYLWRAVTEQPPAPGLSPAGRLSLLLRMAFVWAQTPLWGLAWFLDELLYGRELKTARVEAPLIELSAARSGSTQLGHYLEDDPGLVAPSQLQCAFPYLWLWKGVPATLGRFLTPDKVLDAVHRSAPPAFLQRHELNPFKTDTLEIVFGFLHLSGFCRDLGPRMMQLEQSGEMPLPHSRALYTVDFVNYVEGLGKKLMLLRAHRGLPPARFMVKGHFLQSADALAERFPDARFLTMVREPIPRLESALNFFAVLPQGAALAPVPWRWVSEGAVPLEVAYCRWEQGWYSRQGVHKCVIKFEDYVRDLEGTLRRVYQECLDISALPPHLPRTHAPRERTRYLVHRTLSEAGVDERAVSEALTSYRAWLQT